MNEEAKFPNQKPKKNPLTVVLVIVAVLLLLAVAGMLVLVFTDYGTEEPTIPPATEPTVPTTETEPTVPETTVPVETEPVILEHMKEIHEKYPEVAGWLRIDDTVIDYPVVYTPEDEEKYLRADLDGNYDTAGTLLMETNCSLDPESDNLIIYGHNMRNGSMFRTLMEYKSKSFWEEHPTIYFSTLYKERTYEVVAAFYDRVYYKYEDDFRFYRFIDAENEEHFNEVMEIFAEKALYDTGVETKYGDDFIMLVTCSYHTKNGRFAVLARSVNDNPEFNTTETVPETTAEAANS